MSIEVRHEAKDRFRIAIRGHEIVVDQPEPDSGDAGPTPTELFVASLAACAGFYARRFLARHGLADGDLAISCDFTWAPGHTRVSSISIRVEVPEALSAETERGVLHAVDRCVLHASIRERPIVTCDIVPAREAVALA